MIAAAIVVVIAHKGSQSFFGVAVADRVVVMWLLKDFLTERIIFLCAPHLYPVKL